MICVNNEEWNICLAVEFCTLCNLVICTEGKPYKILMQSFIFIGTIIIRIND